MKSTWWVDPNELDDDQKNVISAPAKKSYLVLGPPGSGKSNLLLLRANYLELLGVPNTLILVFTRQLRDFMASGGANYKFSTDKIKTSTSWMLQLLGENDIHLELPNDFKEARELLVKNVQELLSKRKLSRIYEYLLLDESQDYLPEEVQIFKRLSKYVFAVADIKQKIYDGNDALASLEKMVDKTYPLKFHYRNGLKICKLADGIAKETEDYVSMAAYSNYDEKSKPSTVDVTKVKNLEEMCEMMLSRIDVQLKAYPDELIGILTPRKKELEEISDLLKSKDLFSNDKVQLPDDRHSYLLGDRPVIVSTIHSAKGLEFRAVHICYLENVKHFSKQRNMSFTGVTRAKTVLSIYHSESLPGYFQQSFADMGRPPKTPKLEEVFKKEK